MLKRIRKGQAEILLPHLDTCPGDPLIEMNRIVKVFKTAAGDFTVLKGIDACFYKGEFVSVVGKSGSGKSTLVNMITGIDHPTSGSVRIGGSFVHNLSESQMSEWRGRNLGIVFQFFQLLPMLTLLENVMLPMDFCNMYAPAEREGRAMDLLRLVGLEAYADQLPAAISGGQQQSAAIARALANDPPILIADEPTGNLDSKTAEAVFEIFHGLAEQGKTILMVTHDSSLAARTHRTLLLSDGELIHPRVAEAFPGLPHSQMLWLTHHLQSHHLEPGRALEAQDGLYLVDEGEVELYGLNDGLNGGEALRLGPGLCWSAVDGWEAGLKLRAGRDEPAQLLALAPGDFERWLADDPHARPALAHAVGRLQEQDRKLNRDGKGGRP